MITRRSRRGYIIWAVLLLGGVGIWLVAAAIEHWPKPPVPWGVVGFMPLSDDRLLLARTYEERDSRKTTTFLELVDRQGGMRWKRMLPNVHLDVIGCLHEKHDCLPMSVSSGATALFLTADAQGEARNDALPPKVSAYRLEDGRPLWNGVLENVASTHTPHALAEDLWLSHTMAAEYTLVAIDPRDGTKRWTAPLGLTDDEGVAITTVRGPHLLVVTKHAHSDDIAVHVLARDTGRDHPLAGQREALHRHRRRMVQLGRREALGARIARRLQLPRRAPPQGALFVLAPRPLRSAWAHVLGAGQRARGTWRTTG